MSCNLAGEFSLVPGVHFTLSLHQSGAYQCVERGQVPNTFPEGIQLFFVMRRGGEGPVDQCSWHNGDDL